MSNRKRLRRCSLNAPGGGFGDLLDDLKSEGHLSDRQYLAGCLLLSMLRACHGRSTGLVVSLSDKVDSSRKHPLWPVGGGASISALDGLLKGLRQHERMLLKFLIVHLPLGHLTDWGRTGSAYKADKTMRAVTVGRVTGFLDSVAELLAPSCDAQQSQTHA